MPASGKYASAAGRTFLDGGNSHPRNFRKILEEEHRRWGCSDPPVSEAHLKRALDSVDHTDFVLSPSSFVTRSFLAEGFRADQILRNVYPLDLSCFTPSPVPRPAGRPLTLISTGSLSLRKGTPYLLEAYRLVRQEVPDARLLLTEVVADSARPVLAKSRDLPIEWSPALPHPALAERLRGADLFLLPSLEDGFARTVSEALACGLPALVTPNTGAADFVTPEVTGSIVPIRDPQTLAGAVLRWYEKLRVRQTPPESLADRNAWSRETFDRTFLTQLRALGLL